MRGLSSIPVFEDAEKKIKNCIVIEETALYAQIKELLLADGVKTLSVHSGLTSLEEHTALTEALYPVQIDTSLKLHKLIETLRMEEDEEEIACHRKAQQITDHVFSHICGFIRPGLTELDVSREIGVMLTQSWLG